MAPFASTKHLNIRAYRESDKDIFLAHENDYRERISGDPGYVVPASDDKWKKFQEEHLANVLMMVVVEAKREYLHLRKWDEDEERKADEEKTQAEWDRELYCGHASVQVGMPKNRDGEIGLSLGAQWWGNGFGTEVVEWMVMYSFEQFGLHRVSLGLFANNLAAKRVYEKCGFTVEGLRRKAFWLDGGWVDDLIMGMLDEDYWERKKQLASQA